VPARPEGMRGSLDPGQVRTAADGAMVAARLVSGIVFGLVVIAAAVTLPAGPLVAGSESFIPGSMASSTLAMIMPIRYATP
jgi:hypothetical protein